jgi:hypothetical protein
MTRFAACLTALLVTLCVTTLASAAIRHDPGKPLLPAAPASPMRSPQSEQAYYDQMFVEQGIEPGSSKAHIIRTWVEKILRNPAIASAAGGGAQGISRVFLDPGARKNAMSNGLARLSAADRLRYMKLLTRLLDELVPVNCFGEVDMAVVMNRITLREMSEADLRQYFELLYKVLTGDARNVPIVLPTPQQFALAQQQLSRALFIQLRGNESDFARYQAHSTNPAQATPADACWATRVTLHAIISMRDPERDFILLESVLQGSAPTERPAGGQSTSPSGIPSPASAQPLRAPAP